jgi:NADH dehydrogenase FAD-containing subunit
MPFVQVTLLQSANSILTTFSGSLQERALANFRATGVNVRLAVRVTQVTRDTIQLTADGKQEEMDYGICVWSTGGWGGPGTVSVCTLVDLILIFGTGHSCY